MILVTGGSASGKSEYAERLVLEQGDGKRLYIATMRIWDEESRGKAARHRQMRSEKNFDTLECPAGIGAISADQLAGRTVLLECLSNLTANELFEVGGSTADIRVRIVSGVRHLMCHAGEVVVVTNEVFSDGGSYSDETRAWLRLLGEVNRDLSMLARRVAEIVYGIPVWMKDE